MKWMCIEPGFHTARGGWSVLHDPQAPPADRPWKLRRHGRLVEDCHTLRIAKRRAAAITLQETTEAQR